MRCPICGGHLVQEGITDAIDEFGNQKLDGSVDVQFVCENGHSGWMNLKLDDAEKGTKGAKGVIRSWYYLYVYHYDPKSRKITWHYYGKLKSEGEELCSC